MTLSLIEITQEKKVSEKEAVTKSSKYKDPEVENSLVCSKNRQKESVTRIHWMRKNWEWPESGEMKGGETNPEHGEKLGDCHKFKR